MSFVLFVYLSDVWQLYNLRLMDVGKLEQNWDASCIFTLTAGAS